MHFQCYTCQVGLVSHFMVVDTEAVLTLGSSSCRMES